MQDAGSNCRTSRPSFYTAFLFILPPLLAVMVYAPTISHPLMYDTLLHTQLADGQTLFSVFLPDERFGFYRPLVFFPIVLFQNLLGHYPVWLFHWLNIVTHALNALLLTRLVWRITGQRWQSISTGLLLASFPFAYQALAIYGNNPYLTVTFFILLGLNIAIGDQARPINQWKDQWKLIVIFILGVLVHETAVLLIPLVLYLSWTRSTSALRDFIWNEIQRHGALYFTSALYLIIYLFLPRGGGPTLNFGGNALLPKILLFLQTAAWPFVLGLYQLFDGRAAILSAFALLVGWCIYYFWKDFESRQTASFKIGMIWFALASLLIGITLPTYYIEDGARLLYPGAAGLAILWSALLAPKKQIGLIQTIALLSMIIAGSWFNRRMIGLYEMGSWPIHTIGETLINDRADDDLILVNLPQWVAWPQQVFPAGTEYAPVMGSHLFAAELVWANFGLSPQITILDVPEALTAAPYTYGVYRVGAVGDYQLVKDQSIQVITTEYMAESPTGRWRGSIWADSAEVSVLWSAESIDFLEQIACVQNDGSIIFESWLRPKQKLTESTSLFVQALSADGQLVTQNDGPPLGISPQRLMWAEGVHILDRRVLNSNSVEQEPLSSAVIILSGVYDFMVGEREQAFNANGEMLADNGQRIAIEAGCRANQ
ncbi:MAG: hypothetical protein ACI85U_001603 [Candidatus Promineifilaceae bacterium]|jgi:hypothetical protein